MVGSQKTSVETKNSYVANADAAYKNITSRIALASKKVFFSIGASLQQYTALKNETGKKTFHLRAAFIPCCPFEESFEVEVFTITEHKMHSYVVILGE